MGDVRCEAPCPCGSGKRYKKCCQLENRVETLTRVLLLRTAGKVVPKLMAYASENFGVEALAMAWEEFGGEDLEEYFEESPYEYMFIGWFLYQWVLEEVETEEGRWEDPAGNTIASRFLAAFGDVLDSFTVRYLKAAIREPVLYWQVEAVAPGKGILVRDLLLGRERFIEDVSGSQQMHRWDILLASIVEVGGSAVFNVIAPYTLPARFKRAIEKDLVFKRAAESGSLSEMFDLDFDFIFFYQEMVAEMFAPVDNTPKHTDGTPVIFTSSTYRFDPSSLPVILDRLHPQDGFRLASSVKGKGATGKGRTVFVWGDPEGPGAARAKRVKGRVSVGKRRIETECDTTEWDDQLRRILLALGAGLLTHLKTASRLPGSLSNPDETITGQLVEMGQDVADGLTEEKRAALTNNMEAACMRWVDARHSALGNRTPREAAASRKGRKIVADLINDWENIQLRMGFPEQLFDFNKLRKTLGLHLE